MTLAPTRPLWRIAAIDVALLAAVCLVPTLSHLTAMPLYRLSPMVWILVAGLLTVRDSRNGYVLALLMPLVSMLAVGMPIPLKCLCMTAELTALTFVFNSLRQRLAALPAVAIAVLCGKIAYYSLKTLLLATIF